MENLILSKLIKEISLELTGSRVERVTGCPPMSLLLELHRRPEKGVLFLVVCLDARFPAVFDFPASPPLQTRPTTKPPLLEEVTGSADVLAGELPQSLSDVPAETLPQGFVRSMSDALRGTTLTRLEQHSRDRVVRIAFSRRSGKTHAIMWLELFGRRPNAVLVEPSENRIVACSREGITSAGGFLLRPGGTYAPPSEENKVSVDALSPDALRTLMKVAGPEQLHVKLSRSIKGLSPQAATEILEGTFSQRPCTERASGETASRETASQTAGDDSASPQGHSLTEITAETLLERLTQALLNPEENLSPAVRTAPTSPIGRLIASENTRRGRDSADEATRASKPDERDSVPPSTGDTLERGAQTAEHSVGEPARPTRGGSLEKQTGITDFDLVLFPFGASLHEKEKSYVVKRFRTASAAVRFVFLELCRWYRILSAARVRRCALGLSERLSKLRGSLLQDTASAERSEDYRRAGELILANLKTIAAGSTTPKLKDIHADGTELVQVDLDPSLSLPQNAERYFKKARKAKRALGFLKRRVSSVERAAEAVTEFVGTIPEEIGPPELPVLVGKLNEMVRRLRARRTIDLRGFALTAERQEGTWSGVALRDGVSRRQTGAPKVSAKGQTSQHDRGTAGGQRERIRQQARDTSGKPPAGHPAGPGKHATRDRSIGGFNPRVFVTSDGFTVIVGRNNRENDHITYRVAKPEDLWFHASGMPGSHVILKKKGKSAPSRRAIQEAASIAAYFSKGRTSSAVPVIYTERKYVHKPRGSRPGTATHTREKFLMATPVKPKSASP